MQEGMNITYKMSKAENAVWENILGVLKTKVAPTTYNPWMLSLRPTETLLEKLDKANLVLSSDQAFGIQVLQKKYLGDISDAVYEVTGFRYKIDIIFAPSDVKKSKKKEKDEQTILMEQQLDKLKQMHSFCALNLKYTFENFVVGENSKFAYNAAMAASQAPGQKYNPLFIHGSVGIGKTHLMQAIGHYVMTKFSGLKVKYVKAEEFANTLIENLRSDNTNARMQKFRDTYRNVDVLLIDDVQFIEGKKRCEEEIFNTFDTLYHQGKQIVFASDRPISEFTNTSDRLKSRYEWGLVVDITIPDYETRVEIIKNHAKRSCFEITNDVAEFLAGVYDKNIRELEGAYNKVSAWASINEVDLTPEVAKKVLGRDLNRKKITSKDIIKAVAQYFEVREEDIKSSARAKEISLARQVAIYLAREITENSFPVIAKDFSKTHTTILYCWEKIKQEIQTNKELQKQVGEIKDILKS